MENPQEIYSKILQLVDKLMGSLESAADDEQLKAAQKETLKVLRVLQQDIEAEYASLQKNTEWNRFMIAFYGETNAGKSTIIETLRLVMQEKTKLEAQQKFSEIQKEYNLSEEEFDVIREKLVKLKNLTKELAEQTAKLKRELQAEEDARKVILDELEAKVAAERASRTFWEKIIYFFKKSELEKELSQQREEAKTAIAEIAKRHAGVERKGAETKAEYAGAKQQEEQMLEKCKVLEPFADGLIIGTGEADYTKTNTTYEFNYEGMEFDLIDVPGIEGNESIVQDSILEAVQKAHAVFYVTNKPTAPQTGDGREGTLEKIQKHLGAQTEVWTIYNKRANNPIQLEDALINEEEAAALQDMHHVITGKLGQEHYCGEIVLRGFPAFLSAAKSLVPGSKEKRSQNKFLKKMKREEIYALSGLKQFIEMFPETIVGDWKKKIVASNYNKAIETLNQVIGRLQELQNSKFIPLEENIRRIHQDTKLQLENVVESMTFNLQSVKSEVIGDFESNVRSEIYDVIAGDVGNDTFKSNLRSVMERQQQILEANFSAGIEQKLEVVKQDIENAINKYKEHLDDTIYTFESLDIGEMKLEFNIKSGLDVKALLGTVFSAILFLANPAVGGVALVLAIGNLVISVAKAAWGFFNHSYRREQQRKSADENIRKVSREISEAIDVNLQKLRNGVTEAMPAVEQELAKPLQTVSNINKTMKDARQEFSKMIKGIREDMVNG